MDAYAGKILHVNLTSGQIRTENLDERTAKLYLGGVGLGVNLLMEHSKPGRDAFDPDNPLIYCTGPLSGILGPAGNGYAVVSKSPLTGGVGEGQVQSFFGSELKRAGYDALVIKGKASALSYLWIDDDEIELRGAQHFKGSSVREVGQKICDEMGDFSVRVSGIGEAGEKLCRFATIISDEDHTVGRTGLGAVMGSKNLKAIAVRGTHDVNVANFESFVQFVKTLYERVKNLEPNKRSPIASKNLLELNSLSALATRNWNNSTFEGVEKINAAYLNDRYVKRAIGCATCEMNCNRVAVVSDVPFKDDVVARLDFDCLLSLGPLCGVDRLDAIVKATSLINDYGMDCVSVGAVIAFAMDLYEHGIITNEQTSGVDLRFGNVDALIDLINKIGKRDGWLGDVLAEGVVRAAEVIGGEAVKFACHVKCLELPGYDLRVLKNAALGFSVAFSGDGHLRNGAELLDIKGKVDHSKIESDIGSILVAESQRYNVLDSLILCKLSPEVYTWKDLVDYYMLATGIQVTEDELRQVGDRVENLARLFNILEGKGTRDYDDLPYKIKNCPVSDEGSEKGAVVVDDELQLGIDNYYVACGWTADGIPTVDRLKQVGLGNLAYISESAIKVARAQGIN
ncbi:MAG: aldehyde ferredoxin oxidoreductase family protein [Candidatus Bathyarchaeota archaeon]|nr:aldehyde ferredoxin oxidoreductase family protein [Candidatus Termiticorpusculum sp.]